MVRSGRFFSVGIVLLAGITLLLTLYNFSCQLPAAQWFAAALRPDSSNVAQMVFHYSLLPRLTLALLVGAGLGLAGLLFQLVLRNPLAEPTTLGVSAGAQLGLTVALLWFPGVLVISQFAAMTGALLVGGLVFGLAWGKTLSPLTLILSGLILSLYCGAVNQLLGLFHHDGLQNLYLWSTGTLNQLDWHKVDQLWLPLGIALVLAFLFVRPLALLAVDDGVARNLGLGVAASRIGVLLVAVMLSAQLVNAAGIIAFVALFAPLLTRIFGIRHIGQRLVCTPLFGMLLLWGADQLAMFIARYGYSLTTGTVTALLGAPLLLWLLPRLPDLPAQPASVRVPSRQAGTWRMIALLLVMPVLIMVALSFGRDAQGWHWATGELFQQLIPWRLPRLLAAMASGMLLGAAGCIIQRLMGNPMASPEVLGISSGAACGVVVLLFIVPGDAWQWLLPAATTGAGLTLLSMVMLGGRGGFSPQKMLLAGVSLSTLFSTLILVLMASGDPRMAGLMTWISGSTYQVDAVQAVRIIVITAVLLMVIPLGLRWLTLLPLGEVTARALGVSLTPARLCLLLLAAALTATATLITGPLSFVGLMAPHLSRMLGFRRVTSQLMMALLLGAGIMIIADWCGRMLLFPDQVPAGLLATFIGAPYFIWLLRRV